MEHNGNSPESLLEQVIDQTEQSVVSAGSLSEITRAEVDIQIATAKRYPRSLKRFRHLATEMATLDEETAASCFYSLPRSGKKIEGPSARFAEIIAVAWTNLRCGARIINIGQSLLTAQGFCHDLESNVGATIETQRRITDKGGRRFNDDMIVVTGNAASSIAYRNAVLKVVPKAYWQPVWQAARDTAIGNAQTLSHRRQKAMEFLSKMGVAEKQILLVLGREGIDDITLDDLGTLRGLITAIKDGDVSIEEAFQPAPSEKTSSPPVGRTNMKAPANGNGNGHHKDAPAKVEQPTAESAPVTKDQPADREQLIEQLKNAIRAAKTPDELEAIEADIAMSKDIIGPDGVEYLTELLAAHRKSKGGKGKTAAQGA